ncbi:TetR/AcrR family transcriptional regulator [Mesorhizobium intechi]|uniref:TetR/AcrR family transcriptional regulator n=1 Tax=Mesorhizobium intechi TaxID=537601 RepID=A0A8T9AX76_9HYPH|nr:TetR/AcrR family transcriptional regulator [Mesorhizobium intechi]TSE13410.1 TetR/AcrR family transcriptional regulator [Mesorhizobium intechi]
MPRIVDSTKRRAEITDAAIRILARGGPSALTLRSLAEELNGSITLVTHFFANRAGLFEAIVDDYIACYDSELAELERGLPPLPTLRKFLTWLIPTDERDRGREASRIALNSMRGDKSIDHFFEAMDRRIRELIAAHLGPLMDPKDIPAAVDFLRACTNGITLSSVEHPDLWTTARQLAVVDTAINALPLHDAGRSQRGTSALGT